MDTFQHNYKEKNATRQQIISLMDQAISKVQVAVSWLTDDAIIDKMIITAKRVKLEVLLSNDPLNIFKYNGIREIQKSGGQVLKSGSNFPGVKGFMHAKMIIIDDHQVYGGSFNFTSAANYNYENFSLYSVESAVQIRADFQNWFMEGSDYKTGFESPEKIQALLQEQFELNQSFRNKMKSSLENKYSEIFKDEAVERDEVIKTELLVMQTKQEITNLNQGLSGISNSGVIGPVANGVSVKPHRFYGGTILRTNFDGQKKKDSFQYAYLQKAEIKRKFPFLRCRIDNDVLIVHGNFQPTHCQSYSVKIEYRLGIVPHVYILDKLKAANTDIHVYKKGALCLFYPGDMKWANNTSISEYTIPWIFEWILNYELFLLTGLWESAAVAHG